METLDIIRVAGNERVRIEQDLHPHEPDDEGAPLTILVNEHDDVTVFNERYGDADEVMEAYRRLDQYAYNYRYGYRRYDAWEVVQRLFGIFHDTEIHVSRHHGYSQGDYWTLVSVDTPEWREATGVSDSLTIEQAEWLEPVYWARGDAYTAVHEVYMQTCDNRDHDAWIEQEAVGGFYGDYDDPELRNAMLEGFGLEWQEAISRQS